MHKYIEFSYLINKLPRRRAYEVPYLDGRLNHIFSSAESALGGEGGIKFEIVIIEKIDTISLLKAGLSKYNKRFIDNQTNKVISTKKAAIIFKEPRLLQLDGAFCTLKSSFDF